MIPVRPVPSLARFATIAGVVVAALATFGCASQPNVSVVRALASEISPVAEEVAPRDAWRLGESYAAAHPGCDVVVGSGDSMMPLYRDRTVLVVQPMAMAQLRKGMTVIFIGSLGQPVAHTLVEKTARGWVSMGLANGGPDATCVRVQNYIGTVIKAFAPNPAVAAVRVLPAPTDRLAMLDRGRLGRASFSQLGGN